jgi:Fe-S oxidoreductase
VREAGLGATAYPPGQADTHEGWEDAAVPPERLGDYLRDFRALIEEFGYGPVSLYGHFGQGCVHTRIPFDLSDPDGVRTYRDFVERAARLVVSYGGSLSGEHGDGQSRGELLPLMFGPEVVDLFGRMKSIFDPRNRMNPGKVVNPYRLDENLDRLGYHPKEPKTYFSYPDDKGRFTHAAARCVGIGKCRSSSASASGAVMCPSYRATREEEHSTRGRARVLQEMLNGEIITDGWRSSEVKDALDLCLACKGCRHDCPVDVDMATYKAEFLAHHYHWRPRPPAHYSMGWLPMWAALASTAPRPINAVTHAPLLGRLIKAAGGVDRRRELPRFAPRRFQDWFREHEPQGDGSRGRVVLWPDTFTNSFHPHIGQSAVTVLERAGFVVEVPPVPVCCGLTWISTGQLATAKRVLRRTARALSSRLKRGIPVVGLEPSCTAVFRADAPELFPDDEDFALLRQQTKTLAELLDEHDAVPAAAGDALRAIAQPHCHQHSIMGTEADGRVLKAAGVKAELLDVGCCGLAGNFGFERGHYDVSVAVAEGGVWPAVSEAEAGTVILADGFSCRTQIEAGTDAHPLHLAELLAML